MQPIVVYATNCCLCNQLLFMQPIVVYATNCCLCNQLLFMQPIVVYATNCCLYNQLLFMQPQIKAVEPQLKFQAPALAPEQVDPLKTEKHCNICTTRLPHKLWLRNRNPHFMFRLWLQYLKVFGSNQPTKIVWHRLHSPATNTTSHSFYDARKRCLYLR